MKIFLSSILLLISFDQGNSSTSIDTFPNNLDSFFNAELALFDKIEWKNELGEKIELEEVKDLSQIPLEDSYKAVEYDTSRKAAIPIGHRKDVVRKTLFRPLENRAIKAGIFIELFNTWDNITTGNITDELNFYKWDPLESNDSLFDYFLNRSNRKVLFKSTQRPEQFKEEIIDVILRECYDETPAFQKNLYNDPTNNDIYRYFARINDFLTEEEKIKLTRAVLDRKLRIPETSLFPGYDYCEPIEWNIYSGSDSLRDSIQCLLINFLNKSESSIFTKALYLIDSPEVAEYYVKRLNAIDTITIEDDYYEQLFLFGRIHLQNYIRGSGKSSLSIIKKLLNRETQLVGKTHKKYKYTQLNAVSGLANYTRLNELDSLESVDLIKFIKETGIYQNDAFIRDVIEIIRNLFPSKSHKELKSQLNNLGLSSWILDYLCSPQKFRIDQLNEHLVFLNSLGIDTSQFDSLSRFVFIIDNYHSSDELSFLDLLSRVGVLINTSLSQTSSYRELSDKYLKKLPLKELRTTIYSETINNEYNYKIFLYDNSLGLTVEPDGYKYFSLLVNQYLATKGYDKRLIPFSTCLTDVQGDLFLKPGQAKLIIEKFGLGKVTD